MFSFSLQVLSEAFLILRVIRRNAIINGLRLPVQYPLFLSDFNEIWTVSTDFSKNTSVSIFMKIRPIWAELFHEDRRIDMTKLIVAFRIFADAHNNYARCPHRLLFICFVWISEQTAIISLCSVQWLDFVTEMECLLRGTDWIFKCNSG